MELYIWPLQFSPPPPYTFHALNSSPVYVHAIVLATLWLTAATSQL